MKDKHTSIIVDSHFTYTYYLESADMSSQKILLMKLCFSMLFPQTIQKKILKLPRKITKELENFFSD